MDDKTRAIGIISKAGRYGGTYAHKDIAFEFAMWINPNFNPLEFDGIKKTMCWMWPCSERLVKLNQIAIQQCVSLKTMEVVSCWTKWKISNTHTWMYTRLSFDSLERGMVWVTGESRGQAHHDMLIQKRRRERLMMGGWFSRSTLRPYFFWNDWNDWKVCRRRRKKCDKMGCFQHQTDKFLKICWL